MSVGSQVLKVTLCVQILKWQSVSITDLKSPRLDIELQGQRKHTMGISKVFEWFLQTRHFTKSAVKKRKEQRQFSQADLPRGPLHLFLIAAAVPDQ